MPRPKVTRPEAALHSSAKTPASAGPRGSRTARLRIRIMVSSPAESVPAIIIVVRTPSTDIRYGETTLYDTGCMPPYQARLYAESGCRPTNSAHASCAARSPPLFANVKNQTRCSTPESTVTASTGRLRKTRTRGAKATAKRPPRRSSAPGAAGPSAGSAIREGGRLPGRESSACVGSAAATSRHSPCPVFLMSIGPPPDRSPGVPRPLPVSRR